MADEVQATPAVDEGRVDETPQVAVQDEAPAEAPNTEPDDVDFGVKYDLGDIPDIIRPKVEAHLKGVEKQFKGAYTKKTQTLAEERRSREAEYDKVKQENERFIQVAADVFRDPSKLEHYRRMYGFGPSPAAQAPKAEKPLETVEDLMAAVEAKVESRLRETEGSIFQRTQQQQLAAQQEKRWEDALGEMRQDARFKKYEQVLVNMASDAKYKQMYAKDRSEKAVLTTVMNDFNKLFRDDLEAAKQQGLGALEAKKRASTSMPGKTPTTIPTQTGPRSVEDIIKSVRSKIPKS